MRLLLILGLLASVVVRAQAPLISFQPGDVFVSLESGPVLWRLPDGSPRGVLIPTVSGTGEGMAFDRSGKLYVTRWCVDSTCSTGNTVELFNTFGQSMGTVGSGYDCDPHAIVFGVLGASYVGQTGCRRTLLKFAAGAIVPTAEFVLAEDNPSGAFWVDLAADGCTIFYSSYGPNVKRFDTCAGVQRPDFNVAPLPGGTVHDLRVLPDGGVLASSGDVVARLNSSGVVIQTYGIPPGEDILWTGLDLVGDGTFWAGNYRSSNVYKFDLQTGTVLGRFSTGTPPDSVVGVRVKK